MFTLRIWIRLHSFYTWGSPETSFHFDSSENGGKRRRGCVRAANHAQPWRSIRCTRLSSRRPHSKASTTGGLLDRRAETPGDHGCHRLASLQTSLQPCLNHQVAYQTHQVRHRCNRASPPEQASHQHRHLVRRRSLATWKAHLPVLLPKVHLAGHRLTEARLHGYKCLEVTSCSSTHGA